MTQSHAGRVLTIVNQETNINNLINDTPYEDIWCREVGFNCIQATQGYLKTLDKSIKQPVKILVRGLPINGFFEDLETTPYKLSFLNYGGMTSKELEDSSNFNSTVGKAHGQDECQGQGEKITLLNFTDILKISYKHGRAHYYILTNEDGIPKDKYGIQECTDWVEEYAKERGYDLDHDWTETNILGAPGCLATQNTVTHPNGPGSLQNKNFVWTQLFRRLVDIPNNIDIRFITAKDNDAQPHSAGRREGDNPKFETTFSVFDKALAENPLCKYEKVKAGDGVIYHYYYDAPNGKENANPQTHGYTKGASYNFSSLIHGKFDERERYKVIEGMAWKAISSKFKIYAEEKYFKVDIELPFNKYRVIGNRTELTLRKQHGGKNKPVDYTDFIREGVINRPQWFIDAIEKHNKSIEDADLNELIDKRLEEYDLLFKKGKSDADGSGKEKQKTNPKDRNTEKKKKKKKVDQESGTPKQFAKTKPKHPEVKYSKEKTGDNAIAVYSESANNGDDVIFINNEHILVDTIVEKSKWPDELTQEVRSQVIKEIGVATAVKVIVAKSHLSQGLFDMTKDQFNNILSPTALTFDISQYDKIIARINSNQTLRSMEQGLDIDLQEISNAENNLVEKYKDVPGFQPRTNGKFGTAEVI